jgi:hypothetical protein
MAQHRVAPILKHILSLVRTQDSGTHNVRTTPIWWIQHTILVGRYWLWQYARTESKCIFPVIFVANFNTINDTRMH